MKLRQSEGTHTMPANKTSTCPPTSSAFECQRRKVLIPEKVLPSPLPDPDGSLSAGSAVGVGVGVLSMAKFCAKLDLLALKYIKPN